MSSTIETLTSSLSQRQKSTLLIHGFITILIGFFGGFAWLISMAGYLELWPLPPLDLTVPATKELWRNAHTGPINNGMLVILVVAISPLLKLTPKASKFMTYGAIAMLWGNTLGYSTGPFSTNRGLTPTGDFINILCYGSFYVAVVGAFILVGLGIYGSYKSLLESK
tara:strand:- start:522 stop:1022 length:501 start_codon:yes stop_codon:yes gene_type:complete